ncbi:MAG: hypothetical protein HRU15_10225 [Planctomycetes bacterium]|nr:hypothetical protein [Planctomycetota bacterium]
MGEHVIIDDHGRLVVDGGPQTLLADLKVQHGIDPLLDESYSMHKIGDVWEITYAGENMHLKHFKGMYYLLQLLDKPHIALSVEILKATADKVDPRCLRKGKQEVISQESADEIFQELSRLDDDIFEADTYQNFAKKERLLIEKEKITQYLLKTQGFGNKLKTTSDSARVRASVADALDTALKHIDSVFPTYAEHLRRSIMNPTGSQPCYQPAQDYPWSLSF